MGLKGLRRKLSFHSSGLIYTGISSANICCSNKVGIWGFLRFLGHSLISIAQGRIIGLLDLVLCDAVLILSRMSVRPYSFFWHCPLFIFYIGLSKILALSLSRYHPLLHCAVIISSLFCANCVIVSLLSFLIYSQSRRRGCVP